MRTAIVSLVFYASVSLSTVSADPASISFSSASQEDYNTINTACEAHIRKARKDVAAKSDHFLLYRSSRQCKTLSGNTYCPTFFVRLLESPRCSSLIYTRGNGLVLDESDPLSESSNSKKLDGSVSFLLDAEVGALVVHPLDQFFEFHLVP